MCIYLKDFGSADPKKTILQYLTYNFNWHCGDLPYFRMASRTAKRLIPSKIMVSPLLFRGLRHERLTLYLWCLLCLYDNSWEFCWICWHLISDKSIVISFRDYSPGINLITEATVPETALLSANLYRFSLSMM